MFGSRGAVGGAGGWKTSTVSFTVYQVRNIVMSDVVVCILLSLKEFGICWLEEEPLMHCGVIAITMACLEGQLATCAMAM